MMRQKLVMPLLILVSAISLTACNGTVHKEFPKEFYDLPAKTSPLEKPYRQVDLVKALEAEKSQNKSLRAKIEALNPHK